MFHDQTSSQTVVYLKEHFDMAWSSWFDTLGTSLKMLFIWGYDITSWWHACGCLSGSRDVGSGGLLGVAIR